MAGAPAEGLSEADLKNRLAEAEETLRAIREGEVDALVVRGPQQDEVFSLHGQDSYRAFMEAMETGAAAVDADGNVIYANAALYELLGRTPAALQHDGIFAALGHDGARSLRELLGAGPDKRRSRQVGVPCAGGYRYVEVTAAPLALAFGNGFALTFTDVTERVEIAAVHEGERVGRAIMASSSEAVLVCDRHGNVTHANAGVRHFFDGSVVGKGLDEILPLEFALGSGLMSSADLASIALVGTAVRGIGATLARDGRTLDVRAGAAPLRQSDDIVYGCIVTIADVTEQRDAEKRQALLMGELTHRVRNTLTLVLAIANRTVAGAKDLRDFRVTYSRRLEALAATHNLLVQGAWGGLTVEQIVNAELAPYVTGGAGRLRLSGLEAIVNPDTAVALGLVFHELVTNAVKYGALSSERGTITVSGSSDGEMTEIVWREEGGPPVVQPETTGFGQTLIARGLGARGGKPTVVEFRPEGLVCRMYVSTLEAD